MKTSSLLALVLLWLVPHFDAHAENKFTGKMTKSALTFYGGFTQSNIQSNVTGNLSARNGLAYGLGFDLRISRTFWVGMDLLHVEKNFNIDDGILANYDLAYIEIPFKFRFTPTRFLHLFAGPYLASYLLSAHRSSQGDVDGMKDSFTNDYGITVGGWLGFHPSYTVGIGIDARYEFGVADIQNNGVPYDYINTRSILAMLTVRVEFR